MTAMFGIDSVNLPHVDVYKWAAKRKIFVPVNFRRTPEQEKMFLKIASMRHYFVKLPPIEHQARISEALEEMMKYYPVSGLSDRAIVVVQIAGAIFFAVIYLKNLTSSKL